MNDLTLRWSSKLMIYLLRPDSERPSSAGGSGRWCRLHQQGLDTTMPAAKAMFQMMGVFAKLERSVPGLRGPGMRAHSLGGKAETAVRAALAAGAGICSTAKADGLGVGTVHRIKREMAAAPDR
jgi:hypothetical protein